MKWLWLITLIAVSINGMFPESQAHLIALLTSIVGFTSLLD